MLNGPRQRLAAAALLAAATPASATGYLPAQRCDPDAVFAAAFEDEAAPDDSAGSGGPVAPGNYTLMLGTSATTPYSVRIPPGYSSAAPAPLLVVLHGAAGPGGAVLAAQSARTLWAGTADAAGAILLAPAASGVQGGWVYDLDEPKIAALIADLESKYAIDRSRRYLWGFSAGAHVAYALALDTPERFAAFAVNAGALQQFACDSPLPACGDWLASRTRQPPVAIRIGLSDPLFPLASGDPARLLAAAWRPAEIDYLAFVGGHTVQAGQLPGLWRFLCPFTNAP